MLIKRTSINTGNCANIFNIKIEKKMELIKLQEKIDTTINNIDKLQSQKKNAGVPEAVVTGVVGALTLGGGMSMIMCMSGVAYMASGIAIGVVGLGLGFLGWLIHNKIQKKKLTKLEPIYQSELDKLSDLCEEAAKLVK